MTPDAGMQKTIQDVMVAALIKEVLKQPDVAEALSEAAAKFAPTMIMAISKIASGAGK